MLPEQMRESTRTELFFDDLEKLPSMEVARICEWLTEKVDGFSSKTRAEPKEAEEEASLIVMVSSVSSRPVDTTLTKCCVVCAFAFHCQTCSDISDVLCKFSQALNTILCCRCWNFANGLEMCCCICILQGTLCVSFLLVYVGGRRGDW